MAHAFHTPKRWGAVIRGALRQHSQRSDASRRVEARGGWWRRPRTSREMGRDAEPAAVREQADRATVHPQGNLRGDAPSDRRRRSDRRGEASGGTPRGVRITPTSAGCSGELPRGATSSCRRASSSSHRIARGEVEMRPYRAHLANGATSGAPRRPSCAARRRPRGCRWVPRDAGSGGEQRIAAAADAARLHRAARAARLLALDGVVQRRDFSREMGEHRDVGVAVS